MISDTEIQRFVSDIRFPMSRKTISINPGSGELLQAVICEVDRKWNAVAIEHTLYGKFTG